MKTWARWFSGAAAAASLASAAPAFAQDYDNDQPGPPPGQAAYAPQPQYQDQYQYQDQQDDLDFRGTLSPYGEWISVPGVGEVWRPYQQQVGAGFRPYATAGHWVYTDYGWTWQSDYPWGWATFHYGRWVYRPRWGWMWRPGREWGPAWVEWRQGGGYLGWAPMAPEGVTWVESEDRPTWCFVETSNFVSLRLPSVILAPERVRFAFGSSTPLRVRRSYDRGTFYAGPPMTHVASAIGRPISRVSVDSGHFGWRGGPGRSYAPPPGMGSHTVAPPPVRGYDWHDNRRDDRREWREERHEERRDARPVYVAPPPPARNEWRERQEERREERHEQREERREERHDDHDNGRHGGDRRHER